MDHGKVHILYDFFFLPHVEVDNLKVIIIANIVGRVRRVEVWLWTYGDELCAV